MSAFFLDDNVGIRCVRHREINPYGIKAEEEDLSLELFGQSEGEVRKNGKPSRRPFFFWAWFCCVVLCCVVLYAVTVSFEGPFFYGAAV